MKKVKHDAKRQARRSRALSRLTRDRQRESDVEYQKRKDQEENSLHQRLGL